MGSSTVDWTSSTPTRMDFRILGPLEVLDEGRVVALGGSKQRALLALLLLHANETLSTDRLIDELWGEQPPATAAKTVQVHVSRLRKALRPALATAAWSSRASTATSCELDPEQLDAHRFERLLAEGRSELAAGRPRARRRRRSRRRSRCGAARRSPISPTSRSPSARSRGSRTCAWPRSSC